MVFVKVQSRSGSVLAEKLDVDGKTVLDLKKAFQKQFPKYYPDRQRLTIEKTVLYDKDTLEQHNIQDNTVITFKDLGPQISWRNVFIVEYIGPLFIHPLFYCCQKLFYKNAVEHTPVQKICFLFIMIHFLKREFETICIHRFSNNSMPVKNIFKNSFHYWILSGVNMAYWIYRPGFTSGHLPAATSTYSEVSNLLTHIILRNLRPAGTRVRKIPYGYGFNHVTCPNYFFETLAWVAICLLTGSISSYIFTIVAFAQMYQWAVKKRRNYIKEFGDSFPKQRTAIIPFLL
ncbi:hypothetical protein PIROE2DRAFT_66019 [Piromyces sp. E2]|nr:hypothetical protein PIROE2DRAFT_66019 [Piromyces sp. E2]|eukprot:OUM67001.1 hypothetical protein PIROE2DRAFT_66019 [Piromyces sp. E2]